MGTKKKRKLHRGSKIKHNGPGRNLQNVIKPSTLFLLQIDELRRRTATAPPGTNHLEADHREMLTRRAKQQLSGSHITIRSDAKMGRSHQKNRRREAPQELAAGSREKLTEPPPWSLEQAGGRTSRDMNNTGFRTKKKRSRRQPEPPRLHGQPGRRAHHVDRHHAILPRHHGRPRSPDLMPKAGS
jgi:hypothetical protein